MTPRIFSENSAPCGKSGRLGLTADRGALSVRAIREEKDEYLCKEDAQGSGAPRPPSAARSSGFWSDNRGGFSFDGHRLSSLYRTFRLAPLTLTNTYRAASSL